MERFRVLVFEDNSEIRSTLRQLLGNLGNEVLTFPEPGFCPCTLRENAHVPRSTLVPMLSFPT